MSKQKNRASTTAKLEDDLSEFLKKNKLDVFANRLESEGIFSLDDFEMLKPDDIEKIKKSVDGVGYQNRLGHAYDSLSLNSDQKDEESEFSDRPTNTTSTKKKKTKLKEHQQQQQQSQRPRKGMPKKVPVKSTRQTRPAPEESGPPLVVYFLVITLALVLLGAAILLPDDLKKVAKQAGLAQRYPGRKIYRSMDKFFVFYLTEHTDPTSQLLHVVGTTICALVTLLNPSLLFSQLTGLCAGLVAKPFCNGFSSGIVEGLVALFVGQLAAFSLHSWRKLMFCVLLGYGLAWVGHFRFEKNTPATFQAPMYSLMSDYLLTANYVRQAVMTKKFPLETALNVTSCVIKPETFGPILKQIRSLIPK